MVRTEPSLETASVIRNVPAGGIAATNIQSAINELDAEKVAISGGVVTGNLSVSGTLGVGSTTTFGDSINFTGGYYIQRDATQRLIFGTPSTTRVAIGTGSVFYPVQASTDPTYVQGGIYYNLTSGKLAIGGLSAWEMINSNE